MNRVQRDRLPHYYCIVHLALLVTNRYFVLKALSLSSFQVVRSSSHRIRRIQQFNHGLYAKKRAEKKFDVEEKDTSRHQGASYIRFSRAFQRHVVHKTTACKKGQHEFQTDEPLGSFLFLDEAIMAYPNSTLEKSNTHIFNNEKNETATFHDKDNFEAILGGMGTIPSSTMLYQWKQDKKSTNGAQINLYYLASLVMAGTPGKLPPPGSLQLKQKRDMFVHKLGCDVSPKRFEYQSPESIHYNYGRVMDLLTRGRRKKIGTAEGGVDCLLMQWTLSGLSFSEAEARAVIAAFPQLCLYDIHELEERIKFMIFPMEKDEPNGPINRSSNKEIDYYKMMRRGCGAGLSIEQATEAVKAVPQFLSIYHEDSKKPHVLHFYKNLNVPSKIVEAARSELANSIVGCDTSDLLSFAYLSSLGVRWNQIRLMLDTFPVLTFCDVEPGWELLGNGKVRNELDSIMLNFLRKRLQITNSDLHAMMKTHSRLTTYAVRSNLLPTLNAIQQRLQLSTRELRLLSLRMPSLMGMSVLENDRGEISALDKRISFFTNDVLLSPIQLKESIIKQPSILQYNIDSNLRPKLHFLLDELKVEEASIGRIVHAAPAFWGLSLEENLKAKVATLKERCHFSNEQIGIMIVSVPLLLLISVKQKMEITLSFLASELSLTSRELGYIIQSCPRILLQGINTSLHKKITMLQHAFVEEGHDKKSAVSKTIEVIKQNPSLLVTTNTILQSRIDAYLKKENLSLQDSLQPRSVGRKKMIESQIAIHPAQIRKKRIIVEVERGNVINEFNSVKDAAASVGVSTSSIYSACSNRKQIKGRALQYSDEPQINYPCRSSLDDIRAKPFTLYDKESNSISLVAFASGSIYPKDNIDTVRGMRKAAGIAIQIPQLEKLGETSESKFHEAIKMSFGMVMSKEQGGTNPHEGLVLAGFPFLRPSRNRCDLYACHGALKLILQLLKQAAEERDMRQTDVKIEIYTDSAYAWKLLKESDNLLEWGSASCIEEVQFEVKGPKPLANIDLLFPLSKTVHRMCNNAVINRRRNKRLCIGKHVNITFLHIGDLSFENTQHFPLGKHAKTAAMWHFDKG